MASTVTGEGEDPAGPPRNPRSLGRWVDNPRVRQVATAMAGVLVFYFVTQRLWPAPIGVFVQGMVIGGLTALIAFGIALVYRSNRIINFAQGDLGGVPAASACCCILGPGVPLPPRRAHRPRRRPRPRRRRRVRVHPALLQGAPPDPDGGHHRPVADPRRRRHRSCPALFDLSTGQPRDFAVAVQLRRSRSAPSSSAATTILAMLVGAGRDRRPRAVLPRHQHRHRHPGQRRERRPRRPARRAGEAHPDHRLGRGHRARHRRHVPAGRHRRPAHRQRARPGHPRAGPGRRGHRAHGEAARRSSSPRSPSASSRPAIVFTERQAALVDPTSCSSSSCSAALLLQRRGARRPAATTTSTWQAARDVRPIPRELRRAARGRGGASRASTCRRRARPRRACRCAVREPTQPGSAIVVIFAMVGRVAGGAHRLGRPGEPRPGRASSASAPPSAAASPPRWGWDLVARASSPPAWSARSSPMVIGLPALRIQGLFLAVVTLAFALATSSYLLNREYITLAADRTASSARRSSAGSPSTPRPAIYYLCLACLLVARWPSVRGHAPEPHRAGAHRRPGERARRAGLRRQRDRGQAHARSPSPASSPPSPAACSCTTSRASASRPTPSTQSLQAFIMVVIGGLGSIPGALLGAVFIQGLGYFRRPRSLGRPPVSRLLHHRRRPAHRAALPARRVQPGLLQRSATAALRAVAARRGILVPSLVADRADVDAEVGRWPPRSVADRRHRPRRRRGADPRCRPPSRRSGLDHADDRR